MSVDVAAIREWLDFYAAGYSPPRLRQAREWLAALCDEVEALRGRVAEVEGFRGRMGKEQGMRYRCKSSEIEAVQWKGDNAKEVARIAPYKFGGGSDGGQAWVKAGKGDAMDWIPVPVGHWIARNPGDVTYLWLVDPDDFEAQYEPGGVPASVDVAAIRKAPVGRIAALSADLFNGPDPVPGIEVELPLEQVKARTIGAKVALVAPADLAALCDEVDALRAALAAKDAENERLREALERIEDGYAIPPKEMRRIARAALVDGEATG